MREFAGFVLPIYGNPLVDCCFPFGVWTETEKIFFSFFFGRQKSVATKFTQYWVLWLGAVYCCLGRAVLELEPGRIQKWRANCLGFGFFISLKEVKWKGSLHVPKIMVKTVQLFWNLKLFYKLKKGWKGDVRAFVFNNHFKIELCFINWASYGWFMLKKCHIHCKLWILKGTIFLKHWWHLLNPRYLRPAWLCIFIIKHNSLRLLNMKDSLIFGNEKQK